MFEPGTTEQNRIRASYADQLRDLEFEAIQKRRAALKEQLASSGSSFAQPPCLADSDKGTPWTNGCIGLAISGGGIRSAIFALGVLQAMAKSRFLRWIDFLSTVSGGSYIGAYLGRHYLRESDFDNHIEEATGQKPPKSSIVDAVDNILQSTWSSSVYWLRENGRYLTPRGGGDVLVAAAGGLRDWLSLQALMGMLLLALLFLAHAVRIVYVYWAEPYSPFTGSAVIHSIISYYHHDSVTASWQDNLIRYAGYPLLGAATLFVAASLLYWIGVYLSYRYFKWRSAGRETTQGGAKGNTEQRTARAREAAKKAAAGKSAWRRNMTELLSRILLVVALLGFYRLIDVLGFELYLSPRRFFVATAGAISLVFGILGRFFGSLLLAPKQDKSFLSKLLHVAATLVGLLLLTGYLITLSAISYHWIATHSTESSADISLCRALLLCLSCGFFSFCLNRLDGFLNLTTLHGLYSARLTRAFLGASNPERWKAEGKSVIEPLPKDDIDLIDYRPHESGGPFHIINATLNETVSGESQLEQRDRKGLPVAVSALTMSVGVSHHASIGGLDLSMRLSLTPLATSPDKNASKTAPFEVFPTPSNGDKTPCTTVAEALSLGNWVGISGAAVSTGMGSSSSLGFSMVLAFFNIRLGYWWDSGIAPSTRVAKSPNSPTRRVDALLDRGISFFFRVQTYLLDEFLGRFHGPARQRWNLTDGGHFENTGVYELIRRQLPLIVCLDNGADPDYEFSDLGNLVRRARTDFMAEICFAHLDENNKVDNLSDCAPGASQGFQDLIKSAIETHSGFFGNLNDLRREKKCEASKCHAAVAVIHYAPSDKFGVLIWVKPTLTGDEEADVIEYNTSHEDFPQETTADQFFDEAQWESYRKLGRHIGQHLMQILNPAMVRNLIARP